MAMKALGSTDLTRLDVRDKDARSFFNAIVRLLEQNGYTGLPIYDIAAGSFYWWLPAKSLKATRKAIRQFGSKGSLP